MWHQTNVRCVLIFNFEPKMKNGIFHHFTRYLLIICVLTNSVILLGLPNIPRNIWGRMSYLRYLCLFGHSGVKTILCVVVVVLFFVFVLCTLCCQFLWVVLFSLPLRYSLTFINIYSISDQNRASQMLLHWLLKGVVKQLWILKKV
jgi:hypothetical protein